MWPSVITPILDLPLPPPQKKKKISREQMVKDSVKAMRNIRAL